MSAGERAAPPVSPPQQQESWGLWVKMNTSFMQWSELLMIRLSFSEKKSDICPSYFCFSSFPFFYFWFLCIKREWCFGSHVILSEHNCRCLSLAVFFSLKEALVSRATGNGRTTSLFSTAASPPLFTASLSVCLSLSRSSQAGSGSL